MHRTLAYIARSLFTGPRARRTGWIVGAFLLASWLVIGAAVPNAGHQSRIDNADITTDISLPLALGHATSGTVSRGPASPDRVSAGAGCGAFDVACDAFLASITRSRSVSRVRTVQSHGLQRAFQSRAPPVEPA